MSIFLQWTLITSVIRNHYFLNSCKNQCQQGLLSVLFLTPSQMWIYSSWELWWCFPAHTEKYIFIWERTGGSYSVLCFSPVLEERYLKFTAKDFICLQLCWWKEPKLLVVSNQAWLPKICNGKADYLEACHFARVLLVCGHCHKNLAFSWGNLLRVAQWSSCCRMESATFQLGVHMNHLGRIGSARKQAFARGAMTFPGFCWEMKDVMLCFHCLSARIPWRALYDVVEFEWVLVVIMVWRSREEGGAVASS